MKPYVSKQNSNVYFTNRENIQRIVSILIAIAIFLLLYFGLPDTFSQSAKLMTAIVSFGVILWALEPFPMGLTALLILIMMLLFNLAEPDVVFSGFASPATHLVIAGMMIARAVNETALVKRISYFILKKWGGHANGLLGSLIIVQQIQAFFIPSSAVRATLMLPISSMIVETVEAKPGSNLRKMIMLGVAFGGNISGTAIMTAAVGNILTVELLYQFADIEITYFQWFLYTFPLWLILIPAIWILLIKFYPLRKEEQSFPMVKKEMKTKLDELGSMDQQEWRCLIILLIIVGLWVSQPLHGMHPSVPALIGAVIMTLPGVGCANWENVVKINFNTVLLLSVTLSMGYALVDSGAVTTLSEYLSVDWFLSIVQYPLLAAIIVILLTQIFHKMISNVPAAVVTLIPITISVAANANIDPLGMAFTAGLTSLYGFMMVVETMPNLIVHSTGLIAQRDFLKPGLYATVITMLATILVASTWWRFIGLI
ncbi:DASS family sodium-coupled anion symporter [Virgibacillus sp. NKC19-16]|uniref:SLC13 family permease n=1 Tax=Virgibacillus salidurans TaxID=2831673 RepID=UPI001F1F724B|nr:DASS family sodium-coupled anion symporter [Virgibacillus sp. NKC19-16]UJL45550.1 DASS family sodium-coupled anion symporter [Virgibacillus sp. NKC19-16]